MFGGTAGCLLYLKQAVVCVFDSCDYTKLEIGWADSGEEKDLSIHLLLTSKLSSCI